MNSILIIFIILLLLKLVISATLDWINLRYAQARMNEVPASFRDFIDLPTYQKSVDYTSAKTHFGLISNLYDAAFLALVLLLGILPFFFEMFTEWFGYGVWGQALVLILLSFILSIPAMPFEWWGTFKVEERFGFNKSTQKLWFTDKIKGSVIGFVISYPLLTLLLYLVSAAGSLWWVWGFTVFFIFQLIMVVVYPMFIIYC